MAKRATTEQIQQIKKLVDEGKSDEQISEIVKLGKITVKKYKNEKTSVVPFSLKEEFKKLNLSVEMVQFIKDEIKLENRPTIVIPD